MKKLLILMLALLMVLGVASCASSTNDQTTGADSETTQDSESDETTASTGEKITLRYLLLNDLPNEEGFVAEYNENNQDNIEIILEQVEFAELDRRILLTGATNDAYDIMMTNHSSVPQFASAGILEPLDAMISASGIDLSTFQQAAVNIGLVDGKQVAIPYNPDCRVFAYSAAIFDELGLEAPETMDDVLEAALVISEAGYYSFAANYSKNWFPVYDFGCFMLGNGGHLYVEEDGKYVASVDTPEVIEFVEWSTKMFPTMTQDFNINDDMVREMFMQGRTAMYWFGPWEFEHFDDQVANGEVILTLFPEGSLKSGSSMGGWMLSIGSGSSQKDAAWKFIDHAMVPENMAKMCHALPANSLSFDFPPFNDPKYDIFNEQFETAEYPAPPTAVYPQTAELFNTYYQKAITGEMSAEEACRQAQIEIQRELDTIQ